MPQALQNVTSDRTHSCSPSVQSEALEALAGNASSRQLVALFKHLLERLEAKPTGCDDLQDVVQTRQPSAGQLGRTSQLQQSDGDGFTAHEILMSQLIQQLNVQSQAVEQLQNNCQRRQQQFDSSRAHAAELQQEVGQKRKRIASLTGYEGFQEKKIRTLEKKLQHYRNLCLYIATASEVSHSVTARRSMKQLHEYDHG